MALMVFIGENGKMPAIPSKREGRVFGLFVRWMSCSWDQVGLEVSMGVQSLGRCSPGEKSD